MRAVIYARYSSELQRDASIEDQVRLCVERAKREGWTIVGTYEDRASSGSSMVNRPGIQALLTDARTQKFDLVMSEALDRLSRDQENIASIYKRLIHAEISIFTLAEGEVSELHIGLKGTMNALFLKDLALKIRRGQRGRVTAGHSAGGLSYGYEVVHEFDAEGNLIRGKRRINAEQANVVRLIYTEYVSGKSPRMIASDLNREGIRSPRGGQWNASTINGHRGRRNGILQNELYKGNLVYNRVRMVKNPETGKRISRINPKEEWVTVEVPDLRIVSDELWDGVQEIKARYSQQPAHKSRRAKRLLSGLLRCGQCGGAFTIVRPEKYGCATHREKGTCANSRQISIDQLERRVLSGIKKHLFDPELLAEFVREFHREFKRLLGSSTGKRSHSERRLAQINKQIKRIVDAIMEGTDTPALRSTLLDLEKNKVEIEDNVAAYVEPTVVKLPQNLDALYFQKVEQLQEALNAGDTIRCEAVSILRSLIDSIILRPGKERGNMLIDVCAQPEDLFLLASGGFSSTDRRMIKVVAEEGLEPPTRGL